MKQQQTLKNGRQVFENYSQKDREVWDILLRRQLAGTDSFSALYLKGMEDTGLDLPALPHFERINKVLMQKTGWSLKGVEEFVPLKQFFAYMADKKFPCTTWLRNMAQLDYIEEPDMFHDVFGHVPLLSNRDFTKFLQAFGELALQHAESEEMMVRFQRLYWFTVEFGLIRENGRQRAYGAGILSSPEEISNFQRPEVLIQDFDIEKVIHTGFRTDVIQHQYFVISSFEELYESLTHLSLAGRRADNLPLPDNEVEKHAHDRKKDDDDQPKSLGAASPDTASYNISNGVYPQPQGDQ